MLILSHIDVVYRSWLWVECVRAFCRAETFTNLVPSPSITQMFLGVRHSFLHHGPRTTTNPWEHLRGRPQSFAKAFSFLFFPKKASENENNLGKRLLSPDVHWCARPVKLNQAEERREGGRRGRGTKWNSEPKWEGGRKLVGKKVLIFWREKYILRVYGGIQLILI